MRILGIDFGDKRIGVAVSDPLGFTAQGLETVLNVGPKQVLETLTKLVQQYEAEEIVIGLPTNMDGTLGPKAQQVLKLVASLEPMVSIPVKTWDERLSSRQVGRLMIEQGLSRKKQKENSDQLAAIVILQGYLETKRK